MASKDMTTKKPTGSSKMTDKAKVQAKIKTMQPAKPAKGAVTKAKAAGLSTSMSKGVGAKVAKAVTTGAGKAKPTAKPTGGIKLPDSEKKRFATMAGQTASANYKKKVGGPIGPDARANIEVAAEKRTMKTFGKKKAK